MYDDSARVKGIVCERLAWYEEAEKHYKFACDNNNDPKAVLSYGIMLQRFDRNEEAEKYILAALNGNVSNNHFAFLLSILGLVKSTINSRNVNVFDIAVKRNMEIVLGLDRSKTADRIKNLTDLGQESILLCQTALKFNNHPSGKIKMLSTLAAVYSNNGMHEEGLFCNFEALKLANQNCEVEDSQRMVILNDLGLSCKECNFAEEAEKFFRELLELDAKFYGRRHPNYAITLNNLGLLYLDLFKNVPKSVEYFEKALRIMEHHPSYRLHLTKLYYSLYVCCRLLKEEEKAKEYDEKKKQMIDKYKHNLSYNSLEDEQWNDVLNYPEWHSIKIVRTGFKEFIESFSINEFFDPKNIPSQVKESISQISELGTQNYKSKNYDEALRFFVQALKIWHEINPTGSEESATLHFNIGSMYMLKQDNPAAAHPHLKTACELRIALLGPNHSSTQKAQERLSQCETMLNQPSAVTKSNLGVESSILKVNSPKTDKIIENQDYYSQDRELDKLLEEFESASYLPIREDKIGPNDLVVKKNMQIVSKDNSCFENSKKNMSQSEKILEEALSEFDNVSKLSKNKNDYCQQISRITENANIVDMEYQSSQECCDRRLAEELQQQLNQKSREEAQSLMTVSFEDSNKGNSFQANSTPTILTQFSSHSLQPTQSFPGAGRNSVEEFKYNKDGNILPSPTSQGVAPN